MKAGICCLKKILISVFQSPEPQSPCGESGIPGPRDAVYEFNFIIPR